MTGQVAEQLLFFVVIGLFFWLLLIRPQRARARAMQQVRASLSPGAEVMTSAGLYATVAEVDGDVVVLELSPGVRARFASAAVVRVLDRGAAAVPDDEAADAPRDAEHPPG